jgi:hypothetical protein
MTSLTPQHSSQLPHASWRMSNNSSSLGYPQTHLSTSNLPKIATGGQPGLKEAKNKIFNSSPNFAFAPSSVSDSKALPPLTPQLLQHSGPSDLSHGAKQKHNTTTSTNATLTSSSNQTSWNNTKEAKGVKFGSSSANSLSNDYNSMNHVSPQPSNAALLAASSAKKPILKQQTAATPSGRNLMNSNASDKSSSEARRSSINSNCSSEKNSVMSASAFNRTGMLQPVKLPPIARCSDDFYAVLNDLEKEKCVEYSK